MSYGGKTWGKQSSRARSAGKRKRSRTKTARKSKSRSAPRARKKRTRKASEPLKRSSKRARSSSTRKKRASKKKQRTFGYDPETGDKVYFADIEGGDLEYETLLEKKPRTVSRYDPSTGRKVKVPVTSSMAKDWPTRKPAKTVAGLLKQAAGLGGTAGATYLAESATKRVGRQVTAAAKRAVSRGLGAGIGEVAKSSGLSKNVVAGTVITAALVGWNLGKAINYAVGNLDMRLDQALRNYLAARREAQAKLGRPLTKDELARMYAAYKETVVRIKSQDPSTFLRPGAGG